MARNLVYGSTVLIPSLLSQHRADAAARRPVYDWIAANTPSDAVVFACDDPLLYLHTGRKAVSLPTEPWVLYEPERKNLERFVAQTPGFLARHRARWVVLTPDDFDRDLHEDAREALARVVGSLPGVSEVARSPGGVIYRLPEVHDRLDVSGLRKQVDDRHLVDGVAPAQ